MTVLNLQVNAGNQDARTLIGSFLWDTTLADDFAGNSGGNTGEMWDRWTSVTIPQGTVASSAILSYWASAHGGNGNAKIISKCENADNSTMPTSGSDAAGRTMTTGTTWDFVPTDSAWNTKDIVADVNVVFARSGWASGNALSVRTIDNGSASNAYLQAKRYDGDSTKGAKLDITYSAGGAALTPAYFHNRAVNRASFF